ncbi:MAG: hypothetical protein IJZ96_01655, partial [Lachnospiraceae bacterium]|nr:hypothetical protein [Lachnospiraceae bacterium]
NPGYNDELMDKCKTLSDYSKFVELTRTYEKQYPYETAINLAIDKCINDGILADFLKKHRNEVVSMSIFEYNAKLHEDTLREDSREEGRLEGRQEGRQEERATNISRSITSLRSLSLSDFQIAEYLVKTYDLTTEQANQYIKNVDTV